MNTHHSNNVLDNILDPFQRFLRLETSGGITLMITTLVALIWANSPWSHYYFELWENKLTISLGSFELSKTIQHWINDGLMAIFFFFVGLEIKRELVAGELASFKQASLPIMAALGGMLFPALIFLLSNRTPAFASGWGIPMATDIAFSLGVLTLLGKRVPVSLKVFLIAFAIVDDLGAVLVIAIFYSGDLQWSYLLTGLALFLVLVLFNRLRIYRIPMYMALGWIIWYLFYKSGIHPTIAGVMIAFTIPMNRRIDTGTFRSRLDKSLDYFCPTENCSDEVTLSHQQLAAIDGIETEIQRVQSPVQSLEHTLSHFVTFVIMPIFALSNAGVTFGIESIPKLFSGLSGQIQLSLILGKVTGIVLFTWLAVKLGIGSLPRHIRWIHITGLGLLGGMGFTMSLFIAGLAFSSSYALDLAKIGILTGSLLAGILGYLLLRFSLKNSNDTPQ